MIDSVEKERGRFNIVKRIVGMLSVVKEELYDILFYYIIEGLCIVFYCEMISFLVLRYFCWKELSYVYKNRIFYISVWNIFIYSGVYIFIIIILILLVFCDDVI